MPSSSKTTKKVKGAAATVAAAEAVVTTVVEVAATTENKPEEVVVAAAAAAAAPKRSRASASKKKVAEAVQADTPVPVPVPVPVTAPEPAPEPAPVPAPAPAPAAKKKGGASKKPVKVVAVVTPEGIEGSFTPEPRRPLIAHLPIRTNEVVFHDQPLRYDPTPPRLVDPEPYDAQESDIFHAYQETIPQAEVVAAVEAAAQVVEPEAGTTSVASAAPAVTAVPEARAMPCFTKSELMVQFRGAAEQKLLPVSTDVACFWCAHAFDWTPCVIPEREVAGVYNVYGNFCCPECATAYLLSESMDPHVRWERMALLQRIYDSTGKGRIFPAPARESLKLFGGPMSIDTFRATMREGKVRVDVHMPPMVSILGSIDTKPIDFFDLNMKNGVNGPLLPQRSVEEGLRLKRSKPLKDRESTLDTVMNIRIGMGGVGGGRR